MEGAIWEIALFDRARWALMRRSALSDEEPVVSDGELALRERDFQPEWRHRFEVGSRSTYRAERNAARRWVGILKVAV